MAGDKSILKQRVERLLKADASSFNVAGRLQRAGIAIALVLAVVSLPSVQFATAMIAEHPHENEIENSVQRIVKSSEVEIARAVEAATKAEFIAAEARIKGSEKEIERAVDAVTKALATVEQARAKAMETAVEAKAKIHEKLKQKHKGSKNSYSLSRDDDGWQSGNMQITDNGTSIKVSYDGDFDLAEDERSIKSVEEDGTLSIRTEKGSERRRYRLENDGDGLEATYWINGDKQPFDKGGEKWLAETLTILLKNSAIDMDGRVARALKAGGVKNALKKLAELESDYATRMFVAHLTDQATLKPKEVKQLLKKLASLESDYEIRLTTENLLDEGLITKETLSNALDLSKNIESDYELRLMLTSMIDEFALDDKNMARVLDRAKSMESDYELRLLLSTALDENKLSKANQKRLIATMGSIESDYELRLLISQFADEADLDEAITGDLLKALGSIEGDHEKRLALTQIKGDMPRGDKIEKAFTSAAETISGRRERELLIGRK